MSTQQNQSKRQARKDARSHKTDKRGNSLALSRKQRRAANRLKDRNIFVEKAGGRTEIKPGSAITTVAGHVQHYAGSINHH